MTLQCVQDGVPEEAKEVAADEEEEQVQEQEQEEQEQEKEQEEQEGDTGARGRRNRWTRTEPGTGLAQ